MAGFKPKSFGALPPDVMGGLQADQLSELSKRVIKRFDLDQFEESLRRVRDEEAAFYVTFHQKGVIEGRADFLERVDRFAAVIDRRHAAMLDFLSEPRSLDEMVAHRFVYRPTAETPIADIVETRTAELHLARMIERGEAAEDAPGRYRAR